VGHVVHVRVDVDLERTDSKTDVGSWVIKIISQLMKVISNRLKLQTPRQQHSKRGKFFIN